MIDVKITVDKIDWQSCVDFAFPIVLGIIEKSDKQSLAVRVLKNAGPDMLPVIKKSLEMLDDAEKTEFVQWGAGAFEDKINTAVRKVLNKKGLSHCVTVGSVRAYSGMTPGELEIRICDLDIDYSDEAVRKIIHDRLSISIPSSVTGFLGRTAQSAALRLLSSKACADKLCAIVREKLRGRGIGMEVSSIAIDAHDEVFVRSTVEERKMPEKLENCIVRVSGEIIRQLGM